jgi:DNA-binding beta-propeller fold protein YncE
MQLAVDERNRVCAVGAESLLVVKLDTRSSALLAFSTAVAVALALVVSALGSGSQRDEQKTARHTAKTSGDRPAVAKPKRAHRRRVKATRTPPSDRARLRLRRVLTGNIAPKSVAASGAGLVTAQNMMYRHSVTVYDARTLRLVKTIPDTVQLGRLGYPQFRDAVRGAPVEASFSPDGRYGYISNYSMYGPGFGPEGNDECTPSSGYDRSFVYRVDMASLTVDAAYRVGAVPKVVAVTPDDRFVLVSNWCTWDLSVISTRLGRTVKQIPIGPYPRGIAIARKGLAAYVAVMGGNEVVRVNLRTWATVPIPVGAGPRAIVLDPSGRYLFVSLNAEGRVAKLDLRSGRVLAKVATGIAPRSLALAPDGRSLFVVNYESGSITKLRTADMTPLETISACTHPIGITYDNATRRVWVACYSGSIRVYDYR